MRNALPFEITRTPVRRHMPVLLVEESEDEALLVGKLFHDLGLSKDLHWVRDGNEATLYLSGKGKYSDRARHPLPHFILLELKVPVRDGFEVIRWVRSYKTFARIPIVVFTDCFDDRIIRRAYELGANSFVRKPQDVGARRRMLDSIRSYWAALNLSHGDSKPAVHVVKRHHWEHPTRAHHH